MSDQIITLLSHAPTAGAGEIVRTLPTPEDQRPLADRHVDLAAKGLIVKSPDGLLRRRLRIDNAGALVIEAA